tara:strand:+ start:7845 stop:8195 length:351 start_codon:yes stop_codon:yes gene_type:complete
MHKLFTYGALQRGYPLHGWLTGARFIGTAETVRSMAMYATGIPFVTDKEQVSPIHGELFAVDEAVLAATDRVEGHPNAYTRRLTNVRTSDGETHEAWLYFYDHDMTHRTLVPNGRY